MGKAISMLNPFKNFNVEARAHKIISQEKPKVAPKHKTDKIDIDQMMKDYPEVYEASLKKHQQLDKHLRDVYVKSSGNFENKSENMQDIHRPLPANRSAVEEYDLGYKEPSKVPLGKVTLKSVMKFLTEHQVDPKKHNSTKIAEEYLIPEEAVKNILKYFRVYEIYIPETHNTKAQFAGPAITRRLIYQQKPKELPTGKTKDAEDT